MWTKLASFILRNRLLVLMILAAVTVFMGYQARNVRMSYKFGGLLPKEDSTQIAYENFIENFSEDGNVIIVGANHADLYKLKNFKKWYQLAADIKAVEVPLDSMVNGVETEVMVPAVDSVFAIPQSYELIANKEEVRFEFKRLMSKPPESQEEVDAVLQKIKSLPFYDGLLYQKNSGVTLMMVFVNAELFNSENRGPSVEQIAGLVDRFEAQTGLKTHISGLPYIRTEMTERVKGELRLFIILAAAVTALLLLLFFRNFLVMFVSLIVVSVGVIWSLGTMALFDYPVTMLMGLIPPLMIVIGVPNCIYLLNKYHAEFKKHGNKAKALTRVIQKVGNATFITNMTTAMGFATFIFTSSDILKHFGVIASINIVAVFVISIITIPTLFSYMREPRRRHVRHLDRRWLNLVVNKLVHVVQTKRKQVYIITSVILVIGLYGLSLVQTTGNIVDDLPQTDKVITDLRWFEDQFNGVMPFEVVVDAKRNGQIVKRNNLKRIEKLQDLLKEYPQFSKSLSIVDATKFAKQAFYNGSESKYSLIQNNEQSFIGPYFQSNYETGGVEGTFLDSLKRRTRITTQVADIGTLEMSALLKELRPRIDSIFPPKNYDITLTGTSVVFLEGTNYMVRNLFISLLLAICVIAAMMALLFRSARMVLISLLPNMIPLVATAAIMGYAGIPIKPSTILVFSIAFGISVDDTIHFLAKYRQELKYHAWNIKESVLLAVQETGVSMLYTSIVLFFGFAMFGLSDFEGTRALGVLVSVTLLFAMFTNLLVLPSLLLSFEHSITTQAFKEPFLELIDEEEDIELDELQVRRIQPEEAEQLGE